MKKVSRSAAITLLSIILFAVSVGAGPVPYQPNITFIVRQGLPATMQVGESYTVVVEVTSDVPFISGIALPSAYYPGRYVVAAAGDHSRGGTSTLLSVTFEARESTSQLPNAVAPVAVVAGVRLPRGYIASQRFEFLVSVP